LLPRARRAGWTVSAIASRGAAASRRLSRAAGGAPTVPLEEAAEAAGLLLLAVPDDAIAPLAARLAALRSVRWRGRVVLHHAGALGPAALRPLARKGAAVGVLHPLQVLGRGRGAGDLLAGSRARVEGSPAALRVARRLARDVGLRPFSGTGDWSAADRALYHAAASLVSNDLLALLGRGTALLESLGVSRAEALDGLGALAAGAVTQARRDGLAASMTGPALRGDVETVAAQLRALRRRSRPAAELHARLLEELLRAAEAAETAPAAAELRRIRALLRGGRGTDRTV
jgi:predicted short-subunit dehydrogenase-like oxidoreductase (DUF2520 family)